MCLRFIITSYIFAYKFKIAGKGTHTDATDANKIDVMYLV